MSYKIRQVPFGGGKHNIAGKVWRKKYGEQMIERKKSPAKWKKFLVISAARIISLFFVVYHRIKYGQAKQIRKKSPGTPIPEGQEKI